MHAVNQLIHNRLQGVPDTARLAIVAEDSGMKWVILAGMGARLEAHSVQAEIYGGTSGGGLVMLYHALGQTAHGTLNLTHFSSRGVNGNPRRKFISPLNPFKGRALMDIDYMVEEIFTNLVPLAWGKFANFKKPMFLTATSASGEALVQRVDGCTAADAQQMAKNTSRIPFVGGKIKHHTVWDGALTNPLPIQPTLDLGATHVLVLRCNSPRGTIIETLISPIIYLQCKVLLKLIKERFHHRKKIERAFASHAKVLMVNLDSNHLPSSCTDERKLMDYAMQGWETLGHALNLPPKPFPKVWEPTAVRLGLAAGRQFA